MFVFLCVYDQCVYKYLRCYIIPACIKVSLSAVRCVCTMRAYAVYVYVVYVQYTCLSKRTNLLCPLMNHPKFESTIPDSLCQCLIPLLRHTYAYTAYAERDTFTQVIKI